jgi:hypothetical protein
MQSKVEGLKSKVAPKARSVIPRLGAEGSRMIRGLKRAGFGMKIASKIVESSVLRVDSQKMEANAE